ncbi:DNA cytosine methyltransferase [Nocardia cerradoensis]|uniref:DNA cytosine methyltransferase n=1 Tax=Nocardia cerradoensis TaxID=85688 RepID=UPI0002E94593|nr:DNA (cytosine-5-)-methyltransferase [Nocardia cerradoensis]
MTELRVIETTSDDEVQAGVSSLESGALFDLVEPDTPSAAPMRSGAGSKRRSGGSKRARGTRKTTDLRSAGLVTAERDFTSIEICAGAGGQAVGLHQAGFRHLALIEIDEYAVGTLRLNIEKHELWAWERDNCDIISADVKEFDPVNGLDKGSKILKERGLDLLAGGVPCPPFSHAGKQLGERDERDLFPRMLELVGILNPRAVLIENVRGLMDPKFSTYRAWIKSQIADLGYNLGAWEILEASNFGVPQLRPRAILVAFRDDVIRDIDYTMPEKTCDDPVSIAEILEPSMRERFDNVNAEHSERARQAFERWRDTARNRASELKGKGGGVAPTLVGGSKKHGGADLGPSRARAAWKQLGISGIGVANDIETCLNKGTEERDLFRPDGPMLTVRQAAIVQGFPDEWEFSGGKTAQYRQVGNAFPPPVAKAVGESIIKVLKEADERNRNNEAVECLTANVM